MLKIKPKYFILVNRFREPCYNMSRNKEIDT